MTLPIQPCLRGPRRPPAAGVLLLALVLQGCEAPVPLARGGSDAAPSQEAMLQAHSLLRGGVTLGGPALGSGQMLHTGAQPFPAWQSENL
ncbi:MAG: hypothetical protein A2W04_10225 [Betaproteobacteria bacterium RBG_16_64_9]|nr:MAG: hypothetical protein A2W04_10225 [Betaproteobacteria bacterium RBG_16_64_9]OGA21583.1 MAG: hypothetical protein A3I01_06400 [Betaproteobacteria bacterium RIFCSPLOWO2_02_FULL_65_24]